MPEWLKGTDCKSVGASLRWFESTPAQIKTEMTFVISVFIMSKCGLLQNHHKAELCHWFERERAEAEAILFKAINHDHICRRDNVLSLSKPLEAKIGRTL